ncbi:MAG: oligosaccharide flippase family protein [Flavobacteriales bacterium]
MFKKAVYKKYIIYGSSIIFSRGLEFIVLFFSAHYLTKSDYGELEYYKKLIEVGSSFFAFGFPALIVSYTKSDASKKYFLLLSVLFVLFISLVSSIFMGLASLGFLIIPFVFYALFFNGGIVPAFLLVYKGSNQASYYKSIISVLFYAIILIALYYFDVKGQAYIVVNYIILPLAALYLTFLFFKEDIVMHEVKKYWGLFKKLLLSSFTLVISNFANLMFLYTDIFILKLLSDQSNIDIANYSFALNVANILMLIPLTMVQADIEKLKNDKTYFASINRKIKFLVAGAALLLIVFYYVLTNAIFIDYKETYVIFVIILFAKMFHAVATLYGTNLLIYRKFRDNLKINLFMLLLNIVLSYFLYIEFDIVGVAMGSLLSLAIRYLLLVRVNKSLTIATSK